MTGKESLKEELKDDSIDSGSSSAEDEEGFNEMMEDAEDEENERSKG